MFCESTLLRCRLPCCRARSILASQRGLNRRKAKSQGTEKHGQKSIDSWSFILKQTDSLSCLFTIPPRISKGQGISKIRGRGLQCRRRAQYNRGDHGLASATGTLEETHH